MTDMKFGRMGTEGWALTGPEKIPRQLLKELRERSNGPGLLHLAIHAATLLATGALIQFTLQAWWAWLLASFLHGTVIVLLFAPLHECSHGTAFRSRRLNTAVGMLAGLISMRPFLYFKYRHTAHHTYTQHAALDPDIVAFPSSIGGYVAMIAGASFWKKMLGTLWRGVTGRFSALEQTFIPASDARRVSWEIRGAVAIYLLIAAVSIALQSWAAVLYWLFPRFIGEPVLRAIRMAEHTGAEETPNLLANTRTTLANPVFRTLYWNMPYHAEHHIASSVPFHALGRLHRELKPHLGCVSAGYWQVHRDIVRQVLSQRTRREGVRP
jgi:fatty acid desaturase